MEEQGAAMEVIARASEGMVTLSQALESAVEVFKLEEGSAPASLPPGSSPRPALPGAPRKSPSPGTKERSAYKSPKRR